MLASVWASTPWVASTTRIAPSQAAINKAKFKKKVVPGDTLRLEVKIEKLKKNAGIGQGTAYVGDKVAAQAELVFMIG